MSESHDAKPERTRIAIVDDSEVALDWTRHELGLRGFEVCTHNAPLGVRVFLSKTKPRLLLLDVKMGALNGSTLCELIKEHPVTREIVVVLHSSLPAEELGSIAAACGADAFIVKTQDADQLARQLRELIH